jgi:transposase-like protein
VRWHLRYGLSYLDVEELLAERGIEVDNVTVIPVSAAVHHAANRCSTALPTYSR